jgi:hypothetical protein
MFTAALGNETRLKRRAHPIMITLMSCIALFHLGTIEEKGSFVPFSLLYHTAQFVQDIPTSLATTESNRSLVADAVGSLLGRCANRGIMFTPARAYKSTKYPNQPIWSPSSAK